MRYTVTRGAPPPVKGITLDLAPGEFLAIFRRCVRSLKLGAEEEVIPLFNETAHDFRPALMLKQLEDAAREAGIIL